MFASIRNLCAAAAALAVCGGTAFADEASATETVLVMDPNAKVVFITTGGAEVRADWSEAARGNLRDHYADQLDGAGYRAVLFDVSSVADAEALEQLLLLYEVVAQSTPIDMPHKGGRNTNRELTLGDSVSLLRDAFGADRAVFVDSYSQIESSGVFMTQVLVGAATGYTPPSQNLRITTTNVVDLDDGALVDTAFVMLGDPRHHDESAGMVERMLRNLETLSGAD